MTDKPEDTGWGELKPWEIHVQVRNVLATLHCILNTKTWQANLGWGGWCMMSTRSDGTTESVGPFVRYDNTARWNGTELVEQWAPPQSKPYDLTEINKLLVEKLA